MSGQKEKRLNYCTWREPVSPCFRARRYPKLVEGQFLPRMSRSFALALEPGCPTFSHPSSSIQSSRPICGP